MAYADFVTAMMALFIVLWILAPDPIDRAKVVYDDEIPLEGSPGGPNDQAGLKKTPDTSEEKLDPKKMLEKIGDELIAMLKMQNVEPKPVEVTVLNGILKVTMFDRTNEPVFNLGTADLTKWGDHMIDCLAVVAGRYNMNFFIDGHTARGSSSGAAAKYGPWELSTDRCHAARRKFLSCGTSPDQILRVNAYSDTRPLEGTDPKAPENQRMSVQLTIR